MKRLRLATTTAAVLMIGGCGAVGSFLDPTYGNGGQDEAARFIEVEVEDLKRGLPCSVVDRTGGDQRKVLWRASYEDGFCHAKAEQTSQILEDQGWACQPQSPREWERPARIADPSSSTILHRVAAWRCLASLKAVDTVVAGNPPVPEARPTQPSGSDERQTDVQQAAVAWSVPIPKARQDQAPAPTVDDTVLSDLAEGEPAESDPIGNWGTPALRTVVKKDLKTIGQDVAREQAALDAALGDLDGDGIDDAVVTLIRTSEQDVRPPMLMAYVGNSEAYSLVDVWILRPLDDPEDEALDLTIENGEVRLSGCCEDADEPTVLVLEDRKLAYADGTPR